MKTVTLESAIRYSILYVLYYQQYLGIHRDCRDMLLNTKNISCVRDNVLLGAFQPILQNVFPEFFKEFEVQDKPPERLFNRVKNQLEIERKIEFASGGWIITRLGIDVVESSPLISGIEQKSSGVEIGEMPIEPLGKPIDVTESRHLTAKEAMSLLKQKCSKSTFYKYVKDGVILKHYADPKNKKRAYYLESEIIELRDRKR